MASDTSSDGYPHDSDIEIGVFKKEQIQPESTLPPISQHAYSFMIGTRKAIQNLAFTKGCPPCIKEVPLNDLPIGVRFRAFSKYYKELFGHGHPAEIDHDSLDELHDYYSEHNSEEIARKAQSHVSPLTSFSFTVFGHGGKVIACSHTASKRTGGSKFKDTDPSLEHICAKDLAPKVTHFCTETGAKNYLVRQKPTDVVAADLRGMLFKHAKPDVIRDAHLIGHKIKPHNLVEKKPGFRELKVAFGHQELMAKCDVMTPERSSNHLPGERAMVVGIFHKQAKEQGKRLPPVSTHNYYVFAGTPEAIKNAASSGKLHFEHEIPLTRLPSQLIFQIVSKYHTSLSKRPRDNDKRMLDDLHGNDSSRVIDDAAKMENTHVVPIHSSSYTVFNHGGKVIAVSRHVSKRNPRSTPSKFKNTDTTFEGFCAKLLGTNVTHFCTETAADKYLAKQGDEAAGNLRNSLFKNIKSDPFRDAHLAGHGINSQSIVPKDKWIRGLRRKFLPSRTYKTE